MSEPWRQFQFARFEFKLQDLWVGLFWKKKLFESAIGVHKDVIVVDLWINFWLPCFPFHIQWHYITG